MLTIHKYQLEELEQTIEIPNGFKILSLQVQNDIPCMWVEVNTENHKVMIHVITVGTGHPLPHTDVVYVGTYQRFNGSLVLHVYLT